MKFASSAKFLRFFYCKYALLMLCCVIHSQEVSFIVKSHTPNTQSVSHSQHDWCMSNIPFGSETKDKSIKFRLMKHK